MKKLESAIPLSVIWGYHHRATKILEELRVEAFPHLDPWQFIASYGQSMPTKLSRVAARRFFSQRIQDDLVGHLIPFAKHYWGSGIYRWFPVAYLRVTSSPEQVVEGISPTPPVVPGAPESQPSASSTAQGISRRKSSQPAGQYNTPGTRKHVPDHASCNETAYSSERTHPCHTTPLFASQPHFDRTFGAYAYSFWIPLDDCQSLTGFPDWVQHFLRANKINSMQDYLDQHAAVDAMLGDMVETQDMKRGDVMTFDSTELHAALQGRRMSIDVRLYCEADNSDRVNKLLELANTPMKSIPMKPTLETVGWREEFGVA